MLLGEDLVLPEPAPLRIAWSTRPVAPAPVQDVVKDAVARTARALEGLGHTLVQADPSYAGVQESFLVRYARGRPRRPRPPRRPVPHRATHPRWSRPWARASATAPSPGPAASGSRPPPARSRPAPTSCSRPCSAARRPPVGALTGLRTIALAGRAVPFTPAWNVTGHPAVSVPAGWTSDGLPLAVQLVAAHGRDDLLLALARSLQQADDWTARRPPLGR